MSKRPMAVGTALLRLCDKIEERLRVEPEKLATEPVPEPVQGAGPVDPWLALLGRIEDLPEVYRSVPRLELPPVLRAWATASPRHWSVSLHGPPGSGKTWLAVALMGELAETGARTGFADASEAVEIVRRQIGTDYDGRYLDWLCGIEEGPARRPIERTLLLDDLGAERETDFTRDKLGYVIRRRYDAMRPLVVSSNLTPQALAAIYPREASRLAAGIVLDLAGRDRRLPIVPSIGRS